MKKNSGLFISREGLMALIRRLKGPCDEFIAPKMERPGDIIFTDTKFSGGELLEYRGNSVISPRAFLLPQTEILFKIKSAKARGLAPVRDKRKRVFYGVRPCDAKALALMRRFFLDEPADSFYGEKLGRSVFITLACAEKCSQSSFCREMSAGPVADEGFDLQLIPVKRGYIVDVGSHKGRDIVRRNGKIFSGAPGPYEKEAKGLLRAFGPGRVINYKRLASVMRNDKVGEPVWDDIGLRCVACSGCITLCPTCSCFGVVDRMSGAKGVRMRYCDGCIYAGFTRMAGGNTPSALHKDHIRRFFEHKLNVDVERYGRPGCVGCGRCIETCPGNISIRKFIEAANG